MHLHRLISSDPGLLRFRFALRVVVTLIVSMAAIIPFVIWTDQPTLVVIPGAMLAMVSSTAIRDAKPRDQKISLLMMPFVAFMSACISMFFASNVLASDIVFMLIIFVAVLVRWFGPRGLALGMIAYMTYFIVVFIGIEAKNLPIVLAVQLIATACVYVLKFHVFYNKPEKVLPSAIRAFRLQAAATLYACVNMPPSDEITKRDKKKFDKQLVVLNSVALTVESQLEKIEPKRFAARTYHKDLSAAVFDIELATTQVANIWRDADDMTIKMMNRIKQSLRAMADDLSGGKLFSRQLLDHGNAKTSSTSRAIDDELSNIARLSKKLRDLNVYKEMRNIAIGNEIHTPEKPRPEFKDVFKTSVQTLIATGLAVTFGTMLSDERSYWAVIAAFVTFIGTSSRGEMAYKGWQRVLGTVGGVLFGSIIGTILGGDKIIDAGLIVVMIFLAMYYMQVAYSLMIFWMTTMLALMYGMLGHFSVELLGLRLMETIIGVGVGSLVAFFVFPVRTETAIKNHVIKGLRDLHDVVKGASNDDIDPLELASETRDLDKTIHDLHKASRPLSYSPLATRNSNIPIKWVRSLSSAAYYSRRLSRRRINWGVTPTELHEPLYKISRGLQYNITRLANIMENDTPRKKGQLRRVDKHIMEFDHLLDKYRKFDETKRPPNMHHLEAYLKITRRLDKVLGNLANIV